MNLHESGEDYLETILRLREEKGQVRSIDVAGALSVSKPSVSVAMKKLRDSGHIEMDETGLLTLTAEGEAVAQRIYERHRVIAKMLMGLGVEPETAAREACKIEHDISADTFEKIKRHIRGQSETL
ncbi:MAG TPA: metal-dependent transcriptional regulator [Candidatus Avoscillospira stercoripullorum]|uniref:Metal-dependent transcriptional regulator n=1 Tax=Candidatus Avoscillospira stercoripullorum TaxID=2840709 RepID=A0A9D1D719_9FIRM|nr:metal-dependent transcriptional regulator [Candidatus Avoscillospira stercoripullorum]